MLIAERIMDETDRRDLRRKRMVTMEKDEKKHVLRGEWQELNNKEWNKQ